jgi:hypothetical protein
MPEYQVRLYFRSVPGRMLGTNYLVQTNVNDNHPSAVARTDAACQMGTNLIFIKYMLN